MQINFIFTLYCIPLIRFDIIFSRNKLARQSPKSSQYFLDKTRKDSNLSSTKPETTPLFAL